MHILDQTEGLVFVAPVVGRIAARGNELAAIVFLQDDVAGKVSERRFEHVEDKLRPRGAARLARAELGAVVLLVLGRGEILQHLLRRAEKNEFAAPVQKHRLVKHLKNFRGRLVNRHDHDLVVRHSTDDLDDVLGILRRQPARRFVEEIDIRGADHVQTDVQPFSLAAGERLFVRLPDDVVASLVETKLRQLAIDAAQAIAASKGAAREGPRRSPDFPRW